MSWSQYNDLSAIWYKWVMLKLCAFAFTFRLVQRALQTVSGVTLYYAKVWL